MPEALLETEPRAEDLSAPLYVAWQITNECNLACLHCIEESGPGKAFKDELTREEVFRVLDAIASAGIPYMSFSGGEPMVHPHFFEMCEYLGERGVQLKVETNGQTITPEAARRIREAGVRGVQVSIDGGSKGTYEKMRVLGSWEKVLEGCRNLVEAGVNLEVNFCPALFNIHEVGEAVDLAHSLGAFSFYSGRIMYTGNAVKTWRLLQPAEEQYARFFKTLEAKASEYEGRMRVYYHKHGIVHELQYRLQNPAALFILLPNGYVKLINSLPFVCGNLRTQSVAEVWESFKRAWKDPRVTGFIGEVTRDPSRLRLLHKWVML